MKIDDITKQNWDEIARAIRNDDVCVIDAWDRQEKKPVHMICVVQPPDQGGDVDLIPVAILLPPDGTTMDRYAPPDPMREGKYMGVVDG